MPELSFSLQIEVYFLRGTYEFARPDHPNEHIEGVSHPGVWTRERQYAGDSPTFSGLIQTASQL